jgi:putative ABC transport system permease protein
MLRTTMLSTTLAGLRAHKLRLVATALAIVLGVGFVAGTLIFGDTAKAALFDQFARAAKNVDVVIGAGSGGQPIALSAPDTARGVSGVAAAEGRMSRQLPVLGKNGRLVDSNNIGMAVSAGTVAALREYDVTSGRAPAGPGEAAVDKDTAKRARYRVGDTVTVLDQEERKQTRKLVGIVDFGTARQYANTPVLVLPQADVVALTGAKDYTEIVVHASPGVTQADLADRLAAALSKDVAFPKNVRVATGETVAKELASDSIGQVDRFVTVLQIFAWIAVLVSGFVIYNTFNILMAQRIREMALLRCVGASRGQLFRSVLVEAVVVGLLGAVLGIGVGLAVAYGLFSGSALLVLPVPSHALVLTAKPVVVALVVGVLITLASALIPAIRATKVAPLAALRTAAVARVGTVRGRIVLIVLAALAAVAGTALTVLGNGLKNNQDGAMLVVAGGVVNFLAVLLTAPLFVGPLTAAIGWLPGRIFGTPAKLASANARRNPGRAAATTVALMIGVGLMSASTVAVASAEATANAELVENYPVDYILRATSLDQKAPPADAQTDAPPADPKGLPTRLAERLRQDRTFSGVARVHRVQAAVDSGEMPLAAIDPAGVKVVNLHADLKPGTVALDKEQAKYQHKKVGDPVTIKTEGGPNRSFTIVALITGSIHTGYAVITWDDFAALHPMADDTMVLVRNADGVSAERSRQHLDAALRDDPLVQVDSLADWREEITGAIDKIIGVVAALLGVAILIALIGIMNTLSLSVFERTRESAMVRALGLTRGQLRGTLLVEAVLMAVVGALVGISFGVTYGWITTRLMFRDNSLVMHVPLGELAGYVALAALAGVVAAVLPARRAAKTSVVSAMAET